jgi:hypothetical protein
MKKALLALTVVALMATTSNAAMLWMEWAGTDSDTVQVVQGGTATAEIWVELAAGDDLINFFAGNESAPMISQTGVTTDIAGWIDASVSGVLGAPGQQISVGTPGAVSPIQGGTFLIAEQTLQVSPAAEIGSLHDITFAHSTVGLLDLTGGAYTFGPSLAGTVPHFFGYGAGSPGVDGGALGSSPRDPLVIEVIVPEPASLALLALGGFALLRRR